MAGETLIMELTGEQGPGRESQVQPPKGVWVRYFDVDLDDEANLPVFTLFNQLDPGAPEEIRPVVAHDHNWTIELADAGAPRPAILRLTRRPTAEYDYWVLRPQHADYDHCVWLLQTFRNPHHHSGRNWLIL